MATVAEYEAFKARQQQASVGKANIVLGQDWQQEPDQLAGDMLFAKEASAAVGNSVPLPMVQDPATRSVFERIVAEKKQSTILTQSPKLADWLRVPENAALTRDDLEGLSWWETAAGAASNAVQRGVTRLPQMYNQWMAEGAAQRAFDADRSFGDIYGEERATVGIEGDLIDTAVGPITDLWTAGSRFMTARLSQAFGGDQQAAAAYYQQQAGEISNQIAAIPMSPAASKVRDEIGALEPTGDIMSDVGNFLRVMGQDPAGFTAFITETAVETAPSLAAAFGVGAVTRNPAAVAATLGGSSALQERFTAPADFLQQQGIDISTPEGAMAAVSDPELMSEAARNGTIRGVIIGALDTISGGVAGETLARSPLLNLVLQSLVQSAFGGGGEAAAQIATGQELNVADVLVEAMAEFVTAPIDVASMAATRFSEGVRKSSGAQQTVEALTEISTQATASVTRNRSPDVFRNFLQTVTANGGRENMFVPADAFTEYFQSAGVDPFELADQLAGMGRADLQTAIETGGAVKIPTSTWAADMAGSEHDQFIIQNSAFSPDDMTGMQAAEFEAMKSDLLAEAWAEAEAARQDADALRQVYDIEREQLVGALRAAGRATDVANAEALPLVEFRRVMAERAGLTPEEFAARYPLPEVRGERPEGLDPRNVDELTRTLAEARGRRTAGVEPRKTPLLEFISERGGVDDPGGELAARDAATVKRPGKKTLRLARGGVMAGVRDMFGAGADRGMDTTARAAVESGFMADDPDVLAWQEAERTGGETIDLSAALLRAIDAELRAEPAGVVDDLGGVEEYLAGLSLSLDDSDADIRAAIEGDGVGRAYGQASPRLLFQSTPENPRWSGDGKDPTEWDGDTLSWKLNDTEKRWLAETDDADQFLTDAGELILGAGEIGQFSELVRENEAAQGRGSVPLRFRTYFQADAGFNGGGARGSIQFPGAGVSNGQTIISLFQSADLSTFLHESGHYFLTVLQDMARLDPSVPVAAEFETIKAWWRDNADAVAKDSGPSVTADDVRNAIDNGTTGNADLDAQIDTGMQEQFARATEQYFLEGTAPSQALRGAFEKFQAWLLSIYRNLRGLNVNVTDELRGVFDRLLATDAEIEAAQADIGADVNLTADDLGMTPEQFDGFVKLRDQARDDAKAKLLAQTMAPIQRAREKWFKDERKKVREEVARNMNAQPVYRAIEWMGNRRWLGDTATDMPEFRLSKDVLVDRYGEGVLSTLPRGQQTVYAVDGGLDPDDVAGWFGFPSGDALVQAMERAPKRVEAIEAETDVKMRERHGDVLRDGSVEELAMDAVHNDKRSRVLSAELAALNEIAGTDRGLTAKEARESARRTVSQMVTRDALRGERFLAAERKAAAEVARLSATVTRGGMWMDRARRKVATQARAAVREGDGSAALTLPVDQANRTTQRFNEDAAALVEAKRRQLMNHALYSESQAFADEVAGAERLVDRLNKSVRRRRAQEGKQTIANDHLDAIAEIIERYDFRKMSGPAEQRRGALNRYVQAMIDAGRENELAIPKRVLEDAARVPYRTLSVADLRGVVDSLKNLESMGRRWQKLLIAKKTREMDEAVDTIVTGLRDNVGSIPSAWVDVGWKTTANRLTSQYLSTFTTASTVIRKIDGREDLGGAYELLKADIDDAAYTERDMREKAAGEIEKLYSVYSRDEQRQMAVLRQWQGLGSFSKWNLISMALNMGNEGNMQRLTNKNARQHLTPAQVEMVKGLLDKRDWDFVQSVWDYLDTYRPMIAERQKRVTGVEPEWVDATALETPVGTYRGGYYPIKYSSQQGGASTPSVNSENDIIRSMQAGSYSKAATKNGHLEARVANVAQSLMLDVGVIAQHTNEVIHDLTFSEPVVNTWRLLNDRRVSDAFVDAGMQDQHDALKLWLKDVAVGQVFASDVMSRITRNLRSGFTVSRLAFNVGTAMLQPSGLTQSAVVAGKRNLANAIMRYMRDPVAMTSEVVGRSRIMKDRRTTFQKDLMDMVAETNMASPTASRFKDLMNRYAVPASLAMMTYAQYYIVDVPTWAAAYEKGMRQFDGDQGKAAQYADVTIGRVQGSGLWSDRSNIERGTLAATVRQNSFVTLFTTLGSYFFAKMNLLMERTDALRGQPLTVGSAAGYAFDVGLLLAGEAAVAMLIGAGKEALFGGDDDDEDENPAMTLGVEAAKVFAAGLPGIRDGVSVFQGFSGGTYASLLDLIVKPAQQSMQGEFDAALVKSFVNLGGVVARLPAAQANRIIDAGWRDLDGEDVNAMEYLFGRPR